MKLTPRSITISSELKFFGLDRGASEGTNLSVTFDIPEGVEGQLLKQLMLREKKSLDLLALACEHIKGSIGAEGYANRKALIERGYAPLLGKSEKEEQQK